MDPVRIFIDGIDRTEEIAKYEDMGGIYRIIFKNKNKAYNYGKNRVQVVVQKNNVINEKDKDNPFDVFKYLKDIATIIGIKTDEGDNLLLNSIESIAHHHKNSLLTNYLTGTIDNSPRIANASIFPFGFNLSQYNAVQKALAHSLSIIEGPPGTGKTQTILNIIANAVIKGQSIAVVSSNNAATKNVYEKLEKSGLDFIAAVLGSVENKKEFIELQIPIPDLSSFELGYVQKVNLQKEASLLLIQVGEYLEHKNKLALVETELTQLQTEAHHFTENYGKHLHSTLEFRAGVKTNLLFEFWHVLERLAQRAKKISFFRKLIFKNRYKLKLKLFAPLSIADAILSCQSQFYVNSIANLSAHCSELHTKLLQFSLDAKMEQYSSISMRIFRAELFDKYKQKKRTSYTIEDLRNKSREFMRDYPVIMSTTYSLRNSLSRGITFDYVVIDESSQVDLVTGALALSCAKNAVIVGDIKQLPNVVTGEMQAKTNEIFAKYKLPTAYHYASHSFLSSLIELFPKVPRTLLREHYRCHPKIIQFCNQKFYDGQLIIHSENTHTREPLLIYKTPPGNHARERMNQRQIDIIKEEIIPKENLADADLGIVTPYRNQTTALQASFSDTKIKADTVDKFQGREHDVIILSTVDNEISDFTDDPHRLNVAISRAKQQLIVVINSSDKNRGNLADLVRYIEYNNYTIKQSKLSSVFDLLYKGFEAQRKKIINRSGKISVYDSENLMYAEIKKILSEKNFVNYDFIAHFPLCHLIRDFSKLDEGEKVYAQNPLTHLDFLIYNKIGKTPILAIEVDGYKFHKRGSRQAARDAMKNAILEKYNFPLLRFSTTGSNEGNKLRNKLHELQT